MSSLMLWLLDINTIALAFTVAMWIRGLTWGRRIARQLGVVETAEGWALAYAFATGSFLFAFQLVGLFWLKTGDSWVRPIYVAIFYLPTQAAMMLALSAGVEPARVEPARKAFKSAPQEYARPRWYWPPIIVLVGAYTVFAIDAATRPPTGWDGLHYHLPMAVRWLQTRGADIFPPDITQNFPGNGMVFNFLLLGAGLERLVSVSMAPQALVTFAVIHALARRFGVGDRGRLIASCVALSLPIVMFQSFSTYVDLFATNLWLCALLALLLATNAKCERVRWRLTAIAGLACGGAMGTKLNVIPFAAMLLALAFALPSLKPRIAGVGRWKSVGAFLCALALTCSFWYVRNMARTGNPVYPMALSVGGLTLFDGAHAEDFFPERPLASQIQRWWAYPWHERRGAGYPFGVGDGLGATFAAFVPIGVVLCLFSRGFWRFWNATSRVRLLVLLLAATGPILFATLCHQTLRFILPMILLSILPAAWVVDRAARRHPFWIGATLTVSLLGAGAVGSLAPAKDILGRWKDSVWERAVYYETPPIIDELPRNTTILNVNAHTKNFALTGADFKVRVIGPAAFEGEVERGQPPEALPAEFGADLVYISGETEPPWLTSAGYEKIYDSALDPGRVFGEPRRLYRVVPTLADGFSPTPDMAPAEAR
jgi:hypothetical protein